MREEDFKEIHKTSKEIADILKDLCENDNRMKRTTKTKIISCIAQLQVISGWAKDIWNHLKERKCSCCEEKKDVLEDANIMDSTKKYAQKESTKDVLEDANIMDSTKKYAQKESTPEDAGKSEEKLIQEMMDIIKRMYTKGAEEDPSRYAENLLSICQMLETTPEQVLGALNGDTKAQEELLSMATAVDMEEGEEEEDDDILQSCCRMFSLFFEDDEDDDDDAVCVIRW